MASSQNRDAASSTSETDRPIQHSNQNSRQSPSTKVGRIGLGIRLLLKGFPTLLVLTILGGLAYYGHHYGWQIPKFSQIAGTDTDEQVLWCDAHGVPEAECIACNPELMPKDFLHGWCIEHGVHECVLHHPQITQLNPTPTTTDEDLNRVAKALAVRPRTRNDSSCRMHLRRIQFPSIAAVDRAGIDIGLVEEGPVIESLPVTGEVVYDPTRIAQVSSRARGTIWQVNANIGDKVEEGDVLALVDATEVGQAKSTVLDALVNLNLADVTLQRLQQLYSSKAISEQELLEANARKIAAEVAVANSVQRLSNLGLPIKSTDLQQRPIKEVRDWLRLLGIPKEGRSETISSSNLLPIFSPRDGTIASRLAVSGEVVEAGQKLFSVVDTNQMWLLLNVPLEETDRIQLGQKVTFEKDGTSGLAEGTVSWISTEVNTQTRTVQVRGELQNQEGRLRDETFGTGHIILREEQKSPLVPKSAIHWEGCCHVAFVRDKDYFKEGSYKVFHTRSVRPGITFDGKTEVIVGLLPGEVIVTKGSGILRAELLKGNLGAG